jgi:hypothetical protein
MKNSLRSVLTFIATMSCSAAPCVLAQSPTHPVTVATASNDDAGLASAAHPASDTSNTAPTVKELLQKFESATGGHDVWASFHSRTMKGLYQTEDSSGFAGIEIVNKEPNKSLSKITLSNGIVLREICDGKAAWIEDPSGGFHSLTGAALESRVRRSNFNDRSTMLVAALTGRIVGTQKVGTHNTYIVEFDADKNDTGRLYFDTDTGLVVRTDDVIRVDGADYKVETYLDDYRLVDGAYFAFRLRRVEKGAIYTLKLTQIKNNVPVDDSVFLKPASAPK